MGFCVIFTKFVAKKSISFEMSEQAGVGWILQEG